MSRIAFVLAMTLVLATPVRAQATGWQLQPSGGSHGLTLTYASDEAVSYRFECAANEVIITETGITKLIDLKTGQPIGDDSGAVMPPGAAMMALFSGKGDPQFLPAEAAKNPFGGWDLTLRLPKDDKQLKSIGKGDMLSLFTTGYTMAVPMDAASRAQWTDFLQRCKATG